MSTSSSKRLFSEQSAPTNPKEWKKFKTEKKAEAKQWKEEKLVKSLQRESNKNVGTGSFKQSKKLGKQQANEKYTVSIALPGSILDNAQSPELRSYLAGQIARAAVIFKVDEIIVFDETGSTSRSSEGKIVLVSSQGKSNLQMARILQYLECPQYLRKSFFPQHKDLQYAGLLNPLDCPHHMRAEDECIYREGVTLNKPVKEGKGSYANIGLKKEVQIDKCLHPGTRVTVQLDSLHTDSSRLKGKAVSPVVPCSEAGLYWGYTVRLASSLGSVFTECPFPDGYDVTIGTSERGEDVDTFTIQSKFKHLLVVFGGLRGLEGALDADQALTIEDPSLLFTSYINTCPLQGSKTIRTEEAILISLGALRPKISEAQLR